MSASRKLAAILAADVVGYSRMMGEDEEGTAQAVRERREAAAPIIATHGGRLFKTMGDGMLIEFPSVVAAVECALAMQKQMAERNAEAAGSNDIVYRIGVHLGDVLVDGDDVLGDGVNIAARLEGVAEPGGVCISGSAYDHVRGRVEVEFVDLGEKTLKNIARPLQVFAARVGPSNVGRSALAPLPATSPAASIAVLPFANMSGDPEQEYFADGISEDIITALSKLSQLMVIARNSSFTFKGKNVDLREVGKTLGVRHLLEGSVRKSGSRIRITAQLIDATTGGHVWAERFDRNLTDIFDVQDDVTAHIVSALSVNLTSGELRRMATARADNQEAYDCYLKGRELWRKGDRQANAQALEWLERAVGLDPGFVPAHAVLAIVRLNEVINDWSPSPEASRQSSIASATRAVALDDTNPDAHFAMAVVTLWLRRHDEALRHAERAIALDPNHSDARLSLGVILHYAGRSKEALPVFDRSLAVDPLFDQILQFQAQAHYVLGRYDEAAEWAKRRIAVNPRTDTSRVFLAASRAQMGRFDEAREAWREALRVNPSYSLEQRRKVLPYKNPEDFERLADGLRKAGLPEP